MQTDVATPLDYHIYFIKTKSCQFCHQPLRAPLHAFYHWRKYHNRTVTISDKPQYFVWYQDEWVEVNMETCMAAMMEKRATAITKPRNIESRLKKD